jgi:hypothetical protein
MMDVVNIGVNAGTYTPTIMGGIKTVSKGRKNQEAP